VPMSSRIQGIPAGYLLCAAVLLTSISWILPAQSGVERERWKDISRRVQRIMEKGDREERLDKVTELVEEGHPFCARIIARGISTSHKRSKRMERKISQAFERNADLYKRLKIQPVQRRGDRTTNDEINENLDLIELLQGLNMEEKKFRREALKLIKKMVRSMEKEKRNILARNLLGELKGAKGNYKTALIDRVGRIPLPSTINAALSLIKSDKDQVLRITAIDALGDCGEEEAADGLVPFLKDPRWQIRVAVVEALGNLRKKVAIPALIEAMGREEGRVREDILETLQAMTGVDKADNPAVWRNWWNENKDQPLKAETKKRKSHRRRGGMKPQGRRAGNHDWRKRQRGTSFYGIQTKSKHIVYILDHSGSMKGPAASGVETGNEGTAGLTKIEVAKNELLKSLESLPPDSTFNILFYSDSFSIFKEKMVKANGTFKREAREYIEGIAANSSTNIYDVLERAFEIGGQGAVDRAYKVNFDTIFFLTDGSPTSGKTTDTGEILAEVGRWNKAKKIKVHCVGIGAHNSPFLQKLAAMTGGQYTSRG